MAFVSVFLKVLHYRESRCLCCLSLPNIQVLAVLLVSIAHFECSGTFTLSFHSRDTRDRPVGVSHTRLGRGLIYFCQIEAFEAFPLIPIHHAQSTYSLVASSQVSYLN